MARTESRSSSEKCRPTPNISRITPISAQLVREPLIGDEAGCERADRDAGEQVADQRRALSRCASAPNTQASASATTIVEISGVSCGISSLPPAAARLGGAARLHRAPVGARPSRASAIIACAIRCSPMMTLVAPWRLQVLGLFVGMRARDDRKLRIDRVRLLDHLSALEAVGDRDQQAACGRVVRGRGKLRIGRVAVRSPRCPAGAAPRRCPRRSRSRTAARWRP